LHDHNIKEIPDLKNTSMNREEQLKYCRKCSNQKVSLKQGIICKLTLDVPAFEGICSTFDEDTELVARLNRTDSNDVHCASGEKRFLNYLLDMVFFYLFCVLLGTVLGIVFAVVSPSSISWLNNDNKITSYILAFIFMSIYYVVQEGMTGRTLAKLITKTKVIDQNGQIPDFKTILLRTLCRFIPFDALSFIGSEGWHDTLSKTRVVEA
jgi:uncharacterized RDD family membrane protein YckC